MKPQTHPTPLDVLRDALAKGDEEAAEQAAQALIAQGPAVVEPLLSLSREEDPDARWWALRILAEIRHPAVVERLLEALADPDPAVQQVAALGLRHQPTPRAVQALIALLDSPDRLTAHLAADALAAIGTDATGALVTVLREGSPAARIEAVRALAQIGDKRSIPALFEALDSPSPFVEYWANEGLERMGVGMVFFNPSGG
ncbi:MAG: HEAT repeat domain-containing protein [Chloroflexi bacterium]|nr:HEAT repeat domain-containing protein [Chloroflexota bacterium]